MLLDQAEITRTGPATRRPAPEITILMPCLNEAETLAACIREAQAAIDVAGVSGEVLIADNGSTDGSGELARSLGARVVNVNARGYGSALMGGIAAARGQYVLMGDADGSYDFGELPKFLERLRAGKDLVMGCRLPAGGGHVLPGAMPWTHRWIGNPVLTALGRLFFAVPAHDFHCGLRAFRRDAVLDLGLQCPGMEFASEMVVKASFVGLPMAEVPVTLRPDRRSRPPHLRSWRDGWRHLRFMLLASPRWLFVMPGLALAALSLVAFLRLAAGPLQLGHVTFDVNTLVLAAAGLVAGVQMILLGVIAKSFAVQQGIAPPTPYINLLQRLHPVEFGIAAGGVLILVGLTYVLTAVAHWRAVGFGDLPYRESVRIVIPAVTAAALGIQLAFSAFALAVLDLGREIRLKRAAP